MKENAPRWRLDSSLSWLIVLITQMDDLRKNINRGEEVKRQIGLPYAIHVTVA